MHKTPLKATAAMMVVQTAIVLSAQTRRPMISSPLSRLAVVRAVSVRNAKNGSAIIDVSVTRPVSYRTFRLSAPERLVVDLQGADKALSKRVYPIQSQLLRRVRIGQWKTDPAIVRVVADLKGPTHFSIKHHASGIQIVLKCRKSGDRPNYGWRTDKTASTRDASNGGPREVPHQFAQKSPLAVHRFKDLTASLTAPELPSQDKLVSITGTDPASSKRGDSRTPALVSEISIKPNSSGETLVDIASTRSVPYRVFQLADPFRLVVDLKDAHDASRWGVYPVDSPVLRRIRVAQWRPGAPPIVRVVADLQGYPIFDVHAAQPGIRIRLKPRQGLGPLIRNPFEFAVPQQRALSEHAPAHSNQAMTATISSPATAQGTPFSGLKVIGFIKKKGSSIQAVISDHAGIYFVPNGGAFENTFRVIAITPDAVELQNIETLDTDWLEYTP